MSTEKFFIADPYNDEHLQLFKEFEEKNNIDTKTMTLFRNIRQTRPEKVYLEELKKSNEVHQSLFFLDETGITDACYIQAEKDRKLFQIYFAPINYSKPNRKLVKLATNYTFDILGMEDTFISIDSNYKDKSLYSALDINGFENLGEDQGTIKYLKEREFEEEKLSMNVKVA